MDTTLNNNNVNDNTATTSAAQHQSDSDALASALGAIGASSDHTFTQADFNLAAHKLGDDDDDDMDDGTGDVNLDGVDDDVDVAELAGVIQGDDDDDDLDLSLIDAQGDLDDAPHRSLFGRPPTIRKACDLCHAAKQKCSGDRPSCTRCIAGGWVCNYAPRQRRRTGQRQPRPHAQSVMDTTSGTPAPAPPKKRKIAHRPSVPTYNSSDLNMKIAMNMAVDLGLANEEDNEVMVQMTDEQMLESIAIDGYLADLPLGTFVHNLPYTAGPNTDNQINFNTDDFHPGEMDQHTTSALRDAIFSLNESSGAHNAGGDGTGDDGQGDGQGDNADGMDPHLALLDLSHAMPEGGETEGNDTSQNDHGLNLGFGGGHSTSGGNGCNHIQLVPHVLSLLTQHGLEPKPGSNTPLTMNVFAPLARSLRLFHSLRHCQTCLNSPHQTLPQLALLSRTATILTFPFPPVNPTNVDSSPQLMLHGARLAGTGLSEAIESHIVGVVWDSWRASIREIFVVFERKAQDVITQTAGLGGGDDENENGEKPQSGDGGDGSGQANGDAAKNGGDKTNGVNGNKPQGAGGTSAETQRAGLMFQAMSRLVTAMDEVEDN